MKQPAYLENIDSLAIKEEDDLRTQGDSDANLPSEVTFNNNSSLINAEHCAADNELFSDEKNLSIEWRISHKNIKEIFDQYDEAKLSGVILDKL